MFAIEVDNGAGFRAATDDSRGGRCRRRCVPDDLAQCEILAGALRDQVMIFVLDRFDPAFFRVAERIGAEPLVVVAAGRGVRPGRWGAPWTVSQACVGWRRRRR